jgi:hypothetical protein
LRPDSYQIGAHLVGGFAQVVVPNRADLDSCAEGDILRGEP